MPALKKTLVNDKGTTLKVSVQYCDSNDVPVDLTGYSAYFTVFDKFGGLALAAHNPTLDSDGWINIHITDETMSLIAVGTYVYQLDLHEPNGDITRLLFGEFVVRSGF